MKFYDKFQITKKFLIIILGLLISGCVPAAGISTQSATSRVTQVATKSVLTDTPFPTQKEKTNSPPTTQPTLEISLEKECIPIEEKIPDDMVLSGVWVRNEATPYLENLDEHVDYIVPLEGGGLFSPRTGDMAISPDGKHLAYIDAYIDPVRNGTEKRILRIIKSSGHSVPMDFWPEDWQWIIGWVDNQSLALYTSKKEIIILNPFTGNLKMFQEPKWVNYESGYWYLLPPYNPSLDFILVKPEYNIFNLQNVQTGEIIWESERGGSSTWSTGDSVLVVVSSKYINVITKDKQAKEFDISNIGIDSASYPIVSYDGQKLVFKGDYSEKIFIFDITQRKITKLCDDGLRFWKESFWSPDNRFVVQEVYKSYYEQFDLLIDTQQLRAYKLTSGQYQHRLVWLAKP